MGRIVVVFVVIVVVVVIIIIIIIIMIRLNKIANVGYAVTEMIPSIT